jgi:hydrogenase nickel incorporation protein HypB
MCATCGCGDPSAVRVLNLSSTAYEHDHVHPHDHDHDHTHPHDHQHEPPTESRTISIEQDLLAKNSALAQSNRRWLADQRITSVNLMSSPGSGKTTLLERTIRDLGGRVPVSVIEGDQETTLDAQRIRATGAPVVQINTGAGCHLDADMLFRGMHELSPMSGSLVFVENVGNLVCPALFDLGETARAVIISVTEGHDKPLKYPHMFAAADVVVVNKTDLLPYVDFDVSRCRENARAVNPDVEVLAVSATTGSALETWYDWLASIHADAHLARPASH